MNFTKIQRRSYLIAILTFCGIAAGILCYWQAVRKGVLPSPVQSLVAPDDGNVPKPITIGARAPMPVPGPSVAPAKAPPRAAIDAEASVPTLSVSQTPPPIPTPTASRTSMSTAAPAPMPTPAPALTTSSSPAARPSSVSPRESKPVLSEAKDPSPDSNSPRRGSNDLANANRIDIPIPKEFSPPPTNFASIVKSAASETASSRLVPITSAVDRAMAAHWLADTNARPIVRVRYDPANILRLAKMGRGVVLASDSEGPTNAHELFLQGSSPDAPPLFAPFSRNIAARFSNYSLGLDPTSAFGALIEVLPAYFPSGAVHLAFVPDPSLATEIFSQVAFAKRTMADELGRSDHLVFEGDLTLSGNDPIFRVLPRTNK